MSKNNDMMCVDFDDATLTDLRWEGEYIRLECKDVSIGEKLFFVTILLFHVTNLSIDHKTTRRTSDSLMDGEDGDIIVLERIENNLSFLIEWHEYSGSRKERLVKFYNISGKKIAVLIGDEIHYDD